MSMSVKAIVLGFGLLAGSALAAQAQTSENLAALPPDAGTPAATPSAVAPSLRYPGPKISDSISIPNPHTQAAIAPSGEYPGPAAGAGTGHMPQHFQAPASYNANPAMNPYSRHLGPSTN